MTDILPGVVLEHSPCPIGCSGGDVAILTGRERLHGLPGEFTVVRCRSCGLMRTDPRPTMDTMGRYYPVSYGPHRMPDIPAPDLPAESGRGLLRLARRLRRYLSYDMYRFRTEHLPPLPPGRMLEVGCATGSFLLRMERLGWEAEGLEFSVRAAETARSLGLKVQAGTPESAPDPRVPYDLIVGWMVLEHLHRPLEGLSAFRRWVRPGGWLALSMPNAGAMEFRLFKDAWFALQVPTHLFHFTPETASLLLARAGWRTEKVFHQRVLGNLAASAAYALRDRGCDGRLARFLSGVPEAGGRLPYRLYPLACLLAAFGQTGRMTIWARRDDD